MCGIPIDRSAGVAGTDELAWGREEGKERRTTEDEQKQKEAGNGQQWSCHVRSLASSVSQLRIAWLCSLCVDLRRRILSIIDLPRRGATVCCILHLSSRKGFSSLSGSLFFLRPFLNGVALLFHFMSTPQTAAHVVSDFCDVAGRVASGTILPPYGGAVGSITWLLGCLAT